MRRVLFSVWGSGERGVTLLELLIALALFAIVAIGTLGALGATNAGGFLEGFPVAFATSRAAKDITAASVYVQGLQEHLAQLGGLTEGTSSFTPASSAPLGFIKPSVESYQLNWTQLDVVIQRWDWYDPDPDPDATGDELYCHINPTTCPTTASADYLLRVQTTLNWQLKDATRTVVMERFVRP